MTIGERIAERRTELGLSQTELAEKAGYANKGNISRLENAGDDITLKQIKRLAEALDTTAQRLLGWNEQSAVMSNDVTDDREKMVILKHNLPFWLGDRFYKVEPAGPYNTKGCTLYSSTCPSCNDTRKIKYKEHNGEEYEAECQVCKRSYVSWGNTIRLKEWEVHEYFVYRLSARGSTFVTDYKNGKCRIESMELIAFHRSADDFIETSVPLVNSMADPAFDNENMMQIMEQNDRFAFRTKKNAEKYRQMLIDLDKEKLREFNEKYRTNHEYPYQ